MNSDAQLELTAKEEKAELNPTPDNYLDLSVGYHKLGRYQDCIDAAYKALKLNPNYAEAYNNIAAAHQALGEWDLAVEANKQALRINRNFTLAKGNLHYALDRRERERAANGLAPAQDKLPIIALARPGGLGDILASLNLIPAIKAANPGKEIWYLCHEWYAKPENLGSTLLAAGCDKVLDSTEVPYWFTRAEKTVGFGWPDDYDDFPGKPMAAKLNHLINYFADEVGVPFDWRSFPSLRIARPKSKYVPDGDYATLQWQAAFSVYKQWPFERWQAVIEQLDFPVVVLNTTTTPNLEDAIALVANARIHLGIDSMAQHLTNFTWVDETGNGRQIPSVILWGSTQPRTAGYPHNTNIFLGLDCQPCFRCAPDRPQRLVATVCDNPPGQTYENPHHACMEGLSVERVVEAAIEKWESART